MRTHNTRKGERFFAPTTIRSLARLWLATMLILTACDSGNGGYNNIGNGEKYDYCVFMEQQTCLSGPFETCANGGIPSNSCPSGYDTGSQVEKPSSSSNKAGNSSSSSSSVVSTGGNSSSSTVQQTGKIEGTPVTYQGQTYKTVKIGTQTWMAENLNYNVSGSKCYGNLESNCNKYGRLYNWATAMDLDASYNSSRYSTTDPVKHRGICPSGWHIPTQAEWNTLSSYIESDKGYSSYDAKHLKATYDWYNNGNGLDSYGFAALPGGAGFSSDFFNAGRYGLWWSSSEGSADSADFRYVLYEDGPMGRKYDDKTGLVSLRCIQD